VRRKAKPLDWVMSRSTSNTLRRLERSLPHMVPTAV
jgi:hypothetical protein